MTTMHRPVTRTARALVHDWRWELRVGFFLVGGIAAHLLGA